MVEFSRLELEKIYKDEYLSDDERKFFFYYYIRGLKLVDTAIEMEKSYSTAVKIKNKLLKKALEII